ncbi:ABC transporter ATP-binding protein [Tuanshanicoccus lijuaniae]|uniref:ABC transporter ATP-binding protein n=1 Tax=Aerococcaceae bacterium zg-1292 TaxID=2774330 RepID=UPI001934EAB2|nr:ABC transporter ATP-binding protein [Aerococcaceae bacterium zg-1292]MBF6977882.1 ABC transporter ATP-binding protein [Aerococcaceae bacterium zg-BR22]QQA38094.1 ABC transporter ATP-binding protein [Aerococcaceae bacterium zg-1292]
MVRELWQFILKRKMLYLAILIGVLINYGMSVFPTRITQGIINGIASNQLTREILHQQLIILIVSILISYITGYFWVRWLFTSQAFYQRELKRTLFRKLSLMRTPYYDKFRSGDMMTRFTSDINNLSELLGYGTMSIFYVFGTFIIIIPQMFIISWWISLISMVPIIILGCLVYFIGKKQDDMVEANREAVASLSNEVLEVVEGIRVTRAYGNSALGAARFAKRTESLRHRANQIMFYQAMYGRVANVFLALSAATVLGFGGYAIAAGQITVGDVVALQMYSWILLDPMWMLSDFILIYKTADISFNKLQELLNTDDDLEADGHELLAFPEKIEFRDYQFQYAGSEYQGLENINVTIEKGQTLGIVGKTGSGKTTFIRQLLRQYPVGKGNIYINDLPIQAYQRDSIERHIGYVPQEHVLFSRTVAENIQVGKENASLKELDYAVAVAAFTQDLERMEKGYETLVGEKGVSVSGGQKQRISIARAAIKEPNILILDDSLSAVDAKTERIIIENIQALRQGKMTIIVTHRLSAVTHADWVIVLEEGKIVEEGTPLQLQNSNGWYAQQYRKQQTHEEADA